MCFVMNTNHLKVSSLADICANRLFIRGVLQHDPPQEPRKLLLQSLDLLALPLVFPTHCGLGGTRAHHVQLVGHNEVPAIAPPQCCSLLRHLSAK